MAGVKGIFQGFASRLRQGERRCPAEYSRRNIRFPGKLRPSRKYGRPYLPAESFPPQESPQDKTGEREIPLKNMAGGRNVPMNGLCTPLSPSQQEHAQVERNVRNKCLPEKDSPQEKSLLRNMPLHRRLQRKNLHRPLTSCRSARNARVCRKRTAEYRWRKPSFSPENRKRSGGSPTAQGKNWLWKRKLTRCAGSPTTPERKNALPRAAWPE